MAADAPDALAFGVARSFSGRRWVLRQSEASRLSALRQAVSLSPALVQILAARGVGADELDDLLSPTLKRLLPDPSVLSDMDEAVARIAAAIERDEQITIFGDYDVDGSCSAALLSDYLTAIGKRARVYIPDRMSEGYGPNAPALLRLKEEGASLIVTVDCGASATAAFATAGDAGLDVVVLDHHAVEALPPVLAHVNPNRSGDASDLGQLCAAGVTFLFLVALNRHLRGTGWFSACGIGEPDLKAFLDLVALATVCDVVPLTGVNRAFVRAGLVKLSAVSRPGLAALSRIAKASPPFTPYTLGFVLGPRINAGGRVGRCSLGHELLTARDEACAASLAAALDRHNRERKTIEAAILEEAMGLAALQQNQPFVLVAEDGWHPGVVGIVAGRLKDRFGKPAFVAGFEGGEGRGSARSVPGLDVGAAIRSAREAGLLGTGGGHAMAAGFSLSRGRLTGFQQHLEQHFAHAAVALDAAQTLELDAAIAASACGEALADDIARIGPFGAGNPEPLLAVADVTLSFADIVGREHLRLRLAGADGSRLDAIAFRAAQSPLGEGLMAARGRPVHLAGRLKCEEWNGRRRVQLHVEDAAAASV